MIVVTFLIPGIKLSGILGAFWMVMALALLNSTLWDSGLFHSLPDVKSVQGLVLVGINGALFWFLVKILPGIEMKGLLPAFLAPITYTVLTVLIQTYGSQINVIETVQTVGKQISEIKNQLLDDSVSSEQVETGKLPVETPS